MRLVFKSGRLLRPHAGESKPLYRNPYFGSSPRRWGDSWTSSMLLAIVFTLVLGIGELLTDPTFSVGEITIVGANRIPSEELIQTTRETLQGRQFIVRRDNIWVMSSTAIERQLIDRWGLEAVEVKKRLPNRLEVAIQEKQPRFRFEAAGAVYLVEETGRVVGMSTAETSKDLILVTRDPSEPFDPGQPLFPMDLGRLLTTTIDRLGVTQIKIASIELLPVKERTVRFQTDKGWQAILDPTRDANEQLDGLLRVYADLPEDRQSSLEYLDTRIPGRVIYQ